MHFRILFILNFFKFVKQLSLILRPVSCQGFYFTSTPTLIAAQQAKADGLPALTGSEKQIRWAESIRQKKMAAAREWLSRHPGEQADKCLAWYGGHASASWWIDHRDERPQRTAKLGATEWLK